MSLPATWVDRIFEKLTLVFGREFTNRWEGLPIADVKADWAHELAGFANWPEAIKYGLENMPSDRAPTVLQFRDMCRKAPAKAMKELPAPKANPDRVKAEIAKLTSRGPYDKQDPKDWARRILARHEAGEKLNPTSLRFAREALRHHLMSEVA
jgi:hypothetical protein